MKIKKLLIANRGEIARRIMRTAKRLGIRTVAVYSDADAHALHVREADESVRLGPASPSESYLDIRRVLDAAEQTSADAVHPGYGFLAESPELAEAVLGRGLIFLGPRPEALRALGEKDRARELAKSLGIPVAKGVVVHGGDADGAPGLPDLCFPLLIKAVAGGGGRGMRIVRDRAELPALLSGAAHEAKAFFGSGELILEELFAPARHVEVQLLADTVGGVVHFFERDCSAQRRNQKVIEESPARELPPETRGALHDAAVRLARAGGLTGLATAEFLVRLDAAGKTGADYIFLEVNPRIQVEHPVTEMVCGVDLVEEHLRVAEGQPLRFEQSAIIERGHAIQARVYAEIPERGFLPSGGTIRNAELPAELPCELRVEHAIQDAEVVGTEYDPLLLKLISWGPSFEVSRERLRNALLRTSLPGVPNNLRWLRSVLDEPRFLSAGLPVDYLGGAAIAPVLAHDAERALFAHLAAPALAGAEQFGSLFALRPVSEKGRSILHVPTRLFAVRSSHHAEAWSLAGRLVSVRAEGSEISLEAEIGGERLVGSVRRVSANVFDLMFQGVATRVSLLPPFAVEYGDPVTLSLLQQDWTIEPEAAIGTDALASASGEVAVRSPFPGTVLKVLSQDGESVSAGQPLFILESMKMEHRIQAARSGRVKDCRATEKMKVLAGDLLCRLV